MKSGKNTLASTTTARGSRARVQPRTSPPRPSRPWRWKARANASSTALSYRAASPAASAASPSPAARPEDEGGQGHARHDDPRGGAGRQGPARHPPGAAIPPVEVEGTGERPFHGAVVQGGLARGVRGLVLPGVQRGEQLPLQRDV